MQYINLLENYDSLHNDLYCDGLSLCLRILEQKKS